MHLEHRMELWEQKMAMVEELKTLIDASPELVDEEMILTAQSAKMEVRRSMKYDIDSFMAREAVLAEREHAHFYGEDDMELMNFDVEYDVGTETVMEREHEEVYGGDDLELMDFQAVEYATETPSMFDKYEKKMDDFMEKLRADYADVTLLQCILYANLVVFSIAATVAYMFYQPPSMETNAKKHALANMPVLSALGNLKMTKKEAKKSFKKKVNQKD